MVARPDIGIEDAVADRGHVVLQPEPDIGAVLQQGEVIDQPPQRRSDTPRGIDRIAQRAQRGEIVVPAGEPWDRHIARALHDFLGEADELCERHGFRRRAVTQHGCASAVFEKALPAVHCGGADGRWCHAVSPEHTFTCCCDARLCDSGQTNIDPIHQMMILNDTGFGMDAAAGMSDPAKRGRGCHARA